MTNLPSMAASIIILLTVYPFDLNPTSHHSIYVFNGDPLIPVLFNNAAPTGLDSRGSHLIHMNISIVFTTCVFYYLSEVFGPTINLHRGCGSPIDSGSPANIGEPELQCKITQITYFSS